MHGLQLPNKPKQPLPPLASSSDHGAPSSSSASSSSASWFKPKLPPNNFAQQRNHARMLRGEKKSPFVPKKAQHSDNAAMRDTRGKERDLSACSIEQLQDMLDKNERLLNSPATFANLPGGDSRLRSRQARIEARLNELVQMHEIKQELDATHIKNEDEPELVKDENGHTARLAATDMQEVYENGLADEANSPQTKRRIAARSQLLNPHSMSLTESLRLQREAVARDRIATERKAQQMELDEKRPEKTGNLLRGALGGHAGLGGFMFGGNDDSDEDELDEADIQDWLNQGKTGVNGELNDEENEQLNPLKTAYMTGWNRAIAEEGG
ncbi:uncharacterized protein JCM15063_002625 [Sporobolomyces koalae]|uniref:uncharacterized protein n=1 Tax=Sporobolomyces koalae TaxID=500713 RepID=UPI003179C2DB